MTKLNEIIFFPWFFWAWSLPVIRVVCCVMNKSDSTIEKDTYLPGPALYSIWN